VTWSSEEVAVDFHLRGSLPILGRTPRVLASLLADLPSEWTMTSEGPGAWSAYDVVGHLIHGERTDWIPRAKRILESGTTAPFDAFDRNAQFRDSGDKSLGELLLEFESLRDANLRELESLRLTTLDMTRQGMHPELGVVTLGQLLATWVVHDLNHIGHVAEVMSRQYREAVGPWRAYLDILG
jgi:hypothetical protein